MSGATGHVKKDAPTCRIFCVVLATPTQNHHIIMLTRQKNKTSGTSRKRTTAAKDALTAAKDASMAAASAAASAATAALAAKATSTKSTASAKNPPEGCLTTAATRLGIPPIVGIPNPNLLNSDVGTCDYRVGGTNHCSNPTLPLKSCGGDGLCRIKVHHLCQIEWEVKNGYEETTILRCQNHHPRVQCHTFQVPALPPIPNSIHAATVMELEEYSIPSFQNEDHFSVYTEGGVGDNGVDDDDGVDGSQLGTLGSVYECNKITLRVVNGKDGWECGWCGKFYAPRHATRALKHLLKIKKGDIATCKAIIPPEYLARYQQLHGHNGNRIESSKQCSEQIDLSVASAQDSAVNTLLQKRGGGFSVSNYSPSHYSQPQGHFVSAAAAAAGSSLASTNTPNISRVRGTNVPYVRGNYALSSNSISQRTMTSCIDIDIRKSNNAAAEMAIADFFHTANIPDAAVEYPEFKRLVRQCRLVDKDFVIPSRMKIGGELLDINYNNISAINKTNLLKESGVFGISVMGDGATIHRMPLMNILAMSGSTPPLTIGIVDCTGHMAAGGKKDATYIADIFEEKLEEYDPNHTLTDIFFFDGASNVQKAGEVLMAKYPRTFCYHGGEHVVSLFFSSIAKIKPIKVSISIALY